VKSTATAPTRAAGKTGFIGAEGDIARSVIFGCTAPAAALFRELSRLDLLGLEPALFQAPGQLGASVEALLCAFFAAVYFLQLSFLLVCHIGTNVCRSKVLADSRGAQPRVVHTLENAGLFAVNSCRCLFPAYTSNEPGILIEAASTFLQQAGCRSTSSSFPSSFSCPSCPSFPYRPCLFS
jgi:hypothetical protein